MWRKPRDVEEPLQPLRVGWHRFGQTFHSREPRRERQKRCRCENEGQERPGDQLYRGRLGLGASSDAADERVVHAEDRGGAGARDRRAPISLPVLSVFARLLRCVLG
jgi:hypothetical protein